MCNLILWDPPQILQCIKMGGLRKYIIYCTISCVLLITVYIFYLVKGSIYVEWRRTGSYVVSYQSLQSGIAAKQSVLFNSHRYISYQPPGNGWNNQRIVIEAAVILAKLLNRTLIVHPLSSHLVGEKMEQTLPLHSRYGYLTYNKMSRSNLLPLSTFLDLEHLSELIPVVEVNTTHHKFLQVYSKNLSFHHVCHSVGYGYWVDRYPSNDQEKHYMNNQVFAPNKGWRQKCIKEKEEAEKNDNAPIIRYVSDLINNTSDIIYFEEGTLFGIQIRFTTLHAATLAQQWILNYVRYKKHLYTLANAVRAKLGTYNTIHVRRIGHIAKKLTPNDWIAEMLANKFSIDVPVYVATDEPHLNWFKPVIKAGFKLYFASNFTDALNLSKLPRNVHCDVLGMYEQLVCVQSDQFIPSLHSTFSSYILRERGEMSQKDGLFIDGLHTAWIKHTTR